MTQTVLGIPPELEHLAEPIDSLNPWPGNARKHDLPVIVESLRVNGQYRPIVARTSDRRILAGHGTWLAAQQLGWPRIAVTWVDVDDQAALRILAVDNRANDLAGYDDTALAAILAEIEDLAGTGFTQADLDQLLADTGPDPIKLTDPDVAPHLGRGAPISQPGDLWTLGPHRLVCGDSTDPATVAQLVDGRPADGMWTDPPYGVDYEGGTGLTIANDDAAGLATLLARAFAAATPHLAAGAPVYVAHADTNRMTFEQAMIDAGWSVRQNLIWVKNALVLGRSDYQYRHEPILEATAPEPGHEPVLYGFTAGGKGRRGRGGPSWYGDNRQTTVFEIPKPPRSAEHPTMKPVALITAHLSNSVRPGATVLDLFGGSGSTLIAAHHLGMRARLVELDPAYSDVICRRWQEHTGSIPIRDGAPVDFSHD